MYITQRKTADLEGMMAVGERFAIGRGWRTLSRWISSARLTSPVNTGLYVSRKVALGESEPLAFVLDKCVYPDVAVLSDAVEIVPRAFGCNS
jgi:hypothetical protein